MKRWRDKVVLDLRYEARDVEQNVVQQDRIDAWFEAKTRGLTGVAKAKLKQRWVIYKRCSVPKLAWDRL